MSEINQVKILTAIVIEVPNGMHEMIFTFKAEAEMRQSQHTECRVEKWRIVSAITLRKGRRAEDPGGTRLSEPMYVIKRQAPKTRQQYKLHAICVFKVINLLMSQHSTTVMVYFGGELLDL